MTAGVTRFYLTNDTAPASPAYESGWEATGSAVRKSLSRRKGGVGATVTASETSTSNVFDTALGQWVSPPMTRAGTLTGNFSFCIARSESNAAGDLISRYSVRVVSPGGTVRGTAAFTGGEFPTTATAALASTISLGSIACQAGDYLVFEYGFRATNAVSTSYSATMYYGGTDRTDLVNGDTSTIGSRSAWIEFDDTSATDLFAGTPFMAASLGASARLAVEMAWGADLTAADTTWQWHDITGDVRQDGDIEISIGSTDEASTSQPAECRVTLDNRAGDYSLSALSANWPNVRKNTPFRVRIDPDGTGYIIAFQGFATEFTPSWDITGRNAVVKFGAHGSLRRLAQGTAPVVSSIKRAYSALTNVVAYWPVEEKFGSRSISSAFSTHPGMAIDSTAEDPYPDFASDSSFLCSDPLPALKTTIWRGVVPTYTSTGEIQVRWLLKMPESTTNGAVLLSIYTAGTMSKWDVVYSTGGQLAVKGYDSAGVLVVDANAGFSADNTTRMMSLSLDQDGADIDWSLGVVGVGYASGGFNSGTATTQTLGRITAVVVNTSGSMDDHIVGHVLVQSAITSLFSDLGQLNANESETVTTRISRVCSENSEPITVNGTTSVPMGPQPRGSLLTLLQDCVDTDLGILYDGRSAGLYYTGRNSIYGASTPALTLDVSAGDLVDEFEPVADDQLNVNRAEAKKEAGPSIVYEDTDGPTGTAAIGTYDTTVSTNTQHSQDVQNYASWAVYRGSISGYRFPSLRVAVHRRPSLATAWLALSLGARIAVTNVNDVRTQLQDETVALTLIGYRMRINQFTWDIDATCVPLSQYAMGRVASNSGDTSDAVLRIETDDSTLAAPAAVGATSLSVASTSALWTTDSDDFPLYIDVEGIRITVTGISGASSPQTFTVTGSTVTKALSSGSQVTLSQPRRIGI